MAHKTDVTVTITDDDTRGVTIMPTAVTVTEAAGANHSANYTVRLNSRPTNNVTITLGGHEGGDFVISPTRRLVFGATTWKTDQVVTVTATDDAIDEDDTETLVITLSVSGGDYGSNLRIKPVTVTITDDDTRGVTIMPTAVTVTEAAGAGRTAEYTVRLNSQPTELVTVNFGGLAQFRLRCQSRHPLLLGR